MDHEKLIAIARRHFEEKGYRVHSGLQFGCELVLYADDPNHVHSDFCVHVVRPESRIDWRTMQTMVRSLPNLHKTLILAHVKEENDIKAGSTRFVVQELAISSEHAPFKQKNKSTITPTVQDIGTQFKS